jgi:transcriptional regulator with XRE-family HTH domain
MTVNEKIKAYIESKGINLTHLAKKIEMSKQNLSSVLSNNDIKLSQLQKICNVLGLPITYFFDEQPDAARHDSNNRANEHEPRYLSKDEQISILMRDMNLKIEQLEECREEVKRLKNSHAPSNVNHQPGAGKE